MKKYSQLHKSFYHKIFILEQNSRNHESFLPRKFGEGRYMLWCGCIMCWTDIRLWIYSLHILCTTNNSYSGFTRIRGWPLSRFDFWPAAISINFHLDRGRRLEYRIYWSALPLERMAASLLRETIKSGMERNQLGWALVEFHWTGLVFLWSYLLTHLCF